MECPKCHRYLKDGSSTHQQCGWGFSFGEERPKCPCAFEGCEDPAVVRLKSANVCHKHYLAMANVKARDWCSSKGLITKEDMLKYVSPKLHAIFRKRNNNTVEF